MLKLLGGTAVALTIAAPLLTEIIDVAIGMDRMVGGDFADGLRNLNELAERP
jgi:hypothetical protein